MSIEFDLESSNSSTHKYFNCKNNKLFQSLHILLTFFILIHIILLSAAASSLSLSAPPEVDVSGEGVYEMNFISSDDASSLSALFQVPEGFGYAGNAKIILHGAQSSCEPSKSGQSLQWDISGALKSCRHITVNEWEPNPEGSDSGKEWIELYNPTSQAVNIGGWKLVDSYYGKIVSIPLGTVIVPDGYQLLTWTNGSLINSYPTSISLLDSSGSEVDRTSAVKDDKNNNLCWARYPNGKDLNSDLDWKFQDATSGSSNGGSSADIYAGESLRLQFNLTAGCSAQSQTELSAEMLSSAGKTFAPALALNIRRANLSISASPDIFDIAKGDEIAWTILLENDGDGAACDAAVNITLDNGLQLVDIDSPNKALNWSYASLAPGSTSQIILKARAVSTKDSYSTHFQAHWGLAPCQKISQLSELGARTAIRKQPDQPRGLAIGEVAGFEIFADLPKGGRDLWINDTFSPGLIYNKSSLSVKGPAVLREISAGNSICWFFGDALSAQTIEIAYNCLLENAPENQDGEVLAGTKASMSWQEGQARKTDSDGAGPLTVLEPDLVLEIKAARPFAAPQGRITFALALYHSDQSSSPAFDVDLQAILPADLTYEPGSAQVLAGPAAEFDAQSLKWHFGALGLEWSAGQKALIRFNATALALPGEQIEGRAIATWTSLEGASAKERTGAGGVNDYLREASARVSVMGLSISKTAAPNPVLVGGALTYTLTYENLGGGAAHNVTICDDLDMAVVFLSADPAPFRNNTHSIAWTVPQLDPDGPHSIVLQVHVKDTLPDGALLANRFNISCDELGPKPINSIYTQVLNETRLAVSKTPLQKAVRRGEEASYIITVCNRGGQIATNVTVRDVFASAVEFVSAWPEMAEDGAWHFASLAPGQCAQMGLTVRVPRTDVSYHSSQNVTGQGFVRSYRDYSTYRPPASLDNRVYVSSDQMQLSASAQVKILAEEGTKLSMREHGSGDYESQEDLRFQTANKSIRLERSVRAKHHPADLPLPGKGPQSVSCLWHEAAQAKNGITNTSFEESYRYSSSLQSESLFDLDENRSLMQTKSDFQGLAHLGTLKRPAFWRERDCFLVEDYAGSFQLSESIQDRGQGLMADRSVSGRGYVAKDGRASGRQRSYESGTGDYRSVERMDSFSGFMAKDMDASHDSHRCKLTPRTFLNASLKWSEGMLSRTPTSLIEEEYSSASRLKKKATFAGPRELVSEASFSGTAKMRAVVGTNGTLAVDRDEVFMGDYEVKRRIMLSGVAKYDRPHLYLQKDGRLVKDVAAYTITITNDGNAAIGPLFLKDLFPPGARFLNATLWPNQIDQNSSNWTLLHLSIGDTLRIGINLNVEKCGGDIINRALVAGNCSMGQVAAKNLSVVFREYLGCCPPENRPAADAAAPGLSCACKGGKTANETDYLDPMQMKMQWDGEEEGSCPLSCPAVDVYNP